MAIHRVQRIALMLWPSFIVGGIGTAVFFSLFDPVMLPLSDTALPFGGGTLAEHRLLIYSAGFFMFWIFAAASSGLTLFLLGPLIDSSKQSLEDQVGI